ncbi:chorismate mutase [Metabacillus idriensis]|uniref:chorismate mutase n=1 Tax=Bacillaceae TaxID=186817 RepID=UPI00105A10FF|nr:MULTISPECIES: chorismate mutase [Bacillaceae]MDR0139800.1 chorismate mutase [Metabacillus idriensis]TDL82575.1 chorismate mutase [Peribacillus frigoritolerans]
MIRAIRGAATVDHNDEDQIIKATEALVLEMIEKNNVEPEDVASVLLSMTADLDAVFPAKALRNFDGWEFVPVMCMQEIPVAGSLEKCIRVMMTVETRLNQKEVKHVYQGKAIVLRPDLTDKE